MLKEFLTSFSFNINELEMKMAQLVKVLLSNLATRV